jgi:Mce-associated membrane protein
MPRGKERRGLSPETPESEAVKSSDDAVVAAETAGKPSAAAELTPSVEEEPAAGEAAAKPRRRWKLSRRRKSEPESVATEEAAADTPESAEPQSQAPEAETEGETAESDEGATEQEPEPILVPHRPAGRRLKIAAAAAAVLFVAGAAFVGATAQPVIANRALVQTKLDIARTAQAAITTLWSYTPDNMDSLADRSARYLAGDFASQYRKFIDSIVATNKQAQVTNTTDVLGSAVESVSGSEASALVYTNSVATSPVSKNIPSLRYLSYRLEMKRDHSDWRITRMTTVTTLDLTPKL